MKYILLTLAIAFSVSGIAQTKTPKPPKPPKPKVTEKKAVEDNSNVPTGIDPGIEPMQVPQAPPDVYSFVEQMPSPTFDMASYIGKNIHYPDSARKNSVQGRVIVKFVVNEDGTISDVNVLRGIGYGCDEEAVRVLQNMPLWKPGKQNGKAVKVYYNQPISFKLDN